MASASCLMCVFLWLVSGRSTALGPPHQEEQVQYHQVAKVGQAKKLLCPVVANPDPIERQWFKDSTAITINHDWSRFRLLKDGSLRIKPVELEDAGQYVCKATNGFGRISMNYTLTVLDKTSPGIVKQEDITNTELPEDDSSTEGVPPRFLQEKMKRQNIVRPVSSSVRLKCRATGKPTPHIQWVKNSVLDLDSQQKWTLKLQKLKEDDSGNYTCIVSNRFGIINYTYTLEVVDFASSNVNIPSDPHDKLLKRNNQDPYSPSYGSSAETNDNSTNSGFMGNQPQIIAIATCSAFVFVIVVGIFILQRRRCNAQSRLTRNAQFNPVPTHDKDMFSHSGHTNPHMIPIVNPNNSCMSNSEKLSKNYSLDMYSDISSVSKSHHQPPGQETKHLKNIHGAY